MSTTAHVKRPWRRFRLAVVSLTVAGMLIPGTSAYAWKPITHVYLAEMALDDAVDDGKVTIYATDFRTGAIKKDGSGKPIKIGDYAVNPDMLEAPGNFRPSSVPASWGPTPIPIS